MLDIKSLDPAFLDSSDVDDAPFRECEPNREIILIKCPRCNHLMAWCCECDTLFPDLTDPKQSFPVTMLDQQRDRVECPACHERFDEFHFLRAPSIRKYLVTRAEIVRVGLEGLLT